MENREFRSMKWDADQAARMKEAGVTLKEIAKRFKIDPGTVKTRLDPEYAATRRAGVNAARRARRGYGYVTKRIVQSVMEPLPMSTPPDTRNLTARLCGDPLPGRSALDRRQGTTGDAR